MASTTRLSLRRPTSHFFLLAIITFTTLLCPLSPSIVYASAQSFRPTTTSGASSVFIDGQQMFMSGGTPDGVGGLSSTNQTFALDLSSRWDVASPRFTALPAGPVSDHNIPNTLLGITSWLFFSHGQAFIYDIVQQAWRFNASVSNLAPLESRILEAVVDPGSGAVLIPGGYTSLGDHYSLMQYMTGDGTTTPTSQPMPDSLAGMEGYAAVWSTRMKRMLVHGGQGADGKLSGDLFAYDPSVAVDGSTNYSTTLPPSWTLLAVNQQDGLGEKQAPSPRQGHCFVPAYGGTKMVLFGGFTNGSERQQQAQVASSDIFVFDVATLSWRKLSLPSEQNAGLGRAYAACANVTFVFNLRLGKFMDQFDPQYKGEGPSGDNSGNFQGDVSKTGTPSMAAIFGGIIGGLAVVFVLAAILFMYLMRRREQEESSLTEKKLTEQEQALYSPRRTPTTPIEKVQFHGGYESGAMKENLRRGPHLSISTLRGPHSPVSPAIVSDTLRGPQSADLHDSQSEGESSTLGSSYVILEHHYPSSAPQLPREFPSTSGPSKH
ncbi:hypothetical protein BG006_010384 [Podila minutissima]|uniref:Galactose oxidase n=1 Tax=Podila minutissima TaxID=64525 RepID=A0A9P5SD88_9FUNG|nr:hypothetical protein BG006_010384 [Podila minutissima]